LLTIQAAFPDAWFAGILDRARLFADPDGRYFGSEDEMNSIIQISEFRRGPIGPLKGGVSGKLFHVEQFGANGKGLGEVCCKWLYFVRDAVAWNYGVLCLVAANGDFWG
jgi:hypothetical protein